MKRKKEMKNTIKEKKNKKLRVLLVLLSLLIIGIAVLFIQRGQYLSYLDIGSQYLKIYQIRELEKFIIFAVNFILVYFLVYFSTKNMQNNLKELFCDEKKKFPDLPKKSISFIIALVVGIIAQFVFAGDFLKIFNIAWFGKKDPILSLDYSYYIIIFPIIRKILIYNLGINIMLLIYVLAYDILTINIKLGGTEFQRLKNSKVTKQIYNIINYIIINISVLILFFLPNIFVSDMFKTRGKESFFLTGASSPDIYIKFVGFLFLPFVILFIFGRLKKSIRNQNTNNIIKNIIVIPVYILLVYISTFAVQMLFFNRNILENQGKYIRQNMIETNVAFDLNLEENIIEKSEILNSETILDNQETISSVPVIPEEIVLQTLNENDTNLKMYKYNYAQLVKNFDENNKIAYFAPREVDAKKASDTATDFTHGNYAIVTSANKTEENGDLKYLSRDFIDQEFKGREIVEPRIYYGMETNSTILTKTKLGSEYDYPLTVSKNKVNNYEGIGGLNLKFLDRLIIGVKTSSPNIIFNSRIDKDTKVLFDRNIIKRVENILPEVRYDKDPYLIVTNEGRLVWVLDGYTVSNYYPYSQRIPLPTEDNRIKKVNYIRNSVKVLVDAYDGDMDIYINKNDPIILNMDNAFKNIFKSMDDIPKEIISSLKYPKFLYDIQSEIIRKYHTNSASVFFSGEDVWEFSLLENQPNKIGKKKINYTVYKNFNEYKTDIGYLTIYTPYGRQNINAYLVGTYENSGPRLKLYEYSRNDNIPGIQFIKTQIMSESLIKEELEELNVIGTKIKSYPMLIPVQNSMIYVEPVYQIYVNKNNHAILKKVIVANGSKVAIGNNLQSAISNLFSDLAINIDIHDPLDRELIIEAIIRMNTTLENAVNSKNLQNIGRYTEELNSLINQLKNLDESIKKKENTENKNNKNIRETEIVDDEFIFNELEEDFIF